MSGNTLIFERDIMQAIGPAYGGDSQIVDLFGRSLNLNSAVGPVGGGNSNRFSCQLNYTVNTPAAKDFKSPNPATLVVQDLTYTSVAKTSGANSITIANVVPASGTHSLSIGVVGNAITVNCATTAAVAATASLATTTPIVFTSVAAGTSRNTQTFETIVSAAAANPTNTVLVTFANTAAAITCTIVPNDGTHNGSTAVNMTTAQLVTLVNTGTVGGLNVTLTDASNLRILQTATGGGAANFAHSGEGDGITATFSGGVAFSSSTSTGTLINAAIAASVPASALVTCAISGTGSNVQTAASATPLAGGVTTTIDTVTSYVTINAHGYTTGLKGRLTSTGTLPAGVTTGVDYFIIKIDANTVQFASSLAHALVGTFIPLTTTGSDGAVNTFTYTSIAGCTLSLYASNDWTFANWVIIQTATTVTTTGSLLLSVPDVAYQYFKITKALTSGSVSVTAIVSCVGEEM